MTPDTFERWLEEFDRVIARRCGGLKHDDLPDLLRPHSKDCTRRRYPSYWRAQRRPLIRLTAQPTTHNPTIHS
jgi:hypothetical protein